VSCPRVLEPVDAEHLATCADCRAAKAAFEKLEQSAPMGAGPGAPPAAALAALRAQPRARSWLAAAGTVIAGHIFVALVAGAIASGLSDFKKDAFGWVIGALWLAALGLGPVFSLAPGRRAPLFGFALGALAAVANLSIIDGFNPPQVGWACLAIEIVASVIPLAVAMNALTQFAFSPLRAAQVGLSAGAVGALAAHLHCPSRALPHLLGLHLVPVLALVAVAVLVRRRLPSKSFAP
jgi:hypothetical protein